MLQESVLDSSQTGRPRPIRQIDQGEACGPRAATDCPCNSHASAAHQRKWASGRDLEFHEGVAALYIHAATLGYAQVRAAVADANVLDGHLIGCVRGAAWTPLFKAAEGGLLRLFVARQVVDEVSEHLERIALARRCDPRLAADWWRRARPLLRIVEVPTTDDPHYDALRVIDPDDVPTAVLSRIVGTRLTWSHDKVVELPGCCTGRGSNCLAGIDHGKNDGRRRVRQHDWCRASCIQVHQLIASV